MYGMYHVVPSERVLYCATLRLGTAFNIRPNPVIYLPISVPGTTWWCGGQHQVESQHMVPGFDSQLGGVFLCEV